MKAEKTTAAKIALNKNPKKRNKIVLSLLIVNFNDLNNFKLTPYNKELPQHFKIFFSELLKNFAVLHIKTEFWQKLSFK